MLKQVLTVAINYGNPALAYPNVQGLPAGVSVDLACRIAESMSLSCQFVCFDAAKDASDAVGVGECDIGFLLQTQLAPKKWLSHSHTWPHKEVFWFAKVHSTFAMKTSITKAS